jgi:GntR family transcriptional regulator, rspAB operon transcriptional repressor
MLTEEETVYRKLRKVIIENKLPKDTFLSQRNLAEQMETAVVTLRCVLRRLENDGLVENVPRWGVRVVQETEEDIIERYYVREILEVGAVKKIFQRRNKDDYRQLIAVAQACDRIELISPDSLSQFADNHQEFHSLVGQLSGVSYLSKLLDQVILKSYMLFNASSGWAKGMDQKTHCELVDKIFNAENEQTAMEVMKVHVQRGLDHEIFALHNHSA